MSVTDRRNHRLVSDRTFNALVSAVWLVALALVGVIAHAVLTTFGFAPTPERVASGVFALFLLVVAVGVSKLR